MDIDINKLVAEKIDKAIEKQLKKTLPDLISGILAVKIDRSIANERKLLDMRTDYQFFIDRIDTAIANEVARRFDEWLRFRKPEIVGGGKK